MQPFATSFARQFDAELFKIMSLHQSISDTNVNSQIYFLCYSLQSTLTLSHQCQQAIVNLVLIIILRWRGAGGTQADFFLKNVPFSVALNGLC